MDAIEYLKFKDEFKDRVFSLIKECFLDVKFNGTNINDAYIAVINDKVIGHISYQVLKDPYKGDIAYISYVCTKKEYRNKGVAHNLLKIVEKELKTKNIHRIMLTSSYDRIIAHKLYLSCGYIKKESDIFIKNI